MWPTMNGLGFSLYFQPFSCGANCFLFQISLCGKQMIVFVCSQTDLGVHPHIWKVGDDKL
jgi:hypothetical protein